MIRQTKAAKPLTELQLAAKPSCHGAKALGLGRQEEARKLWGDGKGTFRTDGQFSSATVRGTSGSCIDRCAGTLTQVVRGSVTVRDLSSTRTSSSGPESSTSHASEVSWVSVFAGFLVAHMVGDYLLQTDWQARHKRRGLAGDPVSRRALFST